MQYIDEPRLLALFVQEQPTEQSDHMDLSGHIFLSIKIVNPCVCCFLNKKMIVITPSDTEE